MSTEANEKERINKVPSVDFNKVHEANIKLMNQAFRTFNVKCADGKYMDVNLLREFSSREIDVNNPINPLLKGYAEDMEEAGSVLRKMTINRFSLADKLIDIDDLRDFVIDNVIAALDLTHLIGLTKDELLTQLLARIETKTESYKKRELEHN